jgi:hypothetical protein
MTLFGRPARVVDMGAPTCDHTLQEALLDAQSELIKQDAESSDERKEVETATDSANTPPKDTGGRDNCKFIETVTDSANTPPNDAVDRHKFIEQLREEAERGGNILRHLKKAKTDRGTNLNDGHRNGDTDMDDDDDHHQDYDIDDCNGAHDDG